MHRALLAALFLGASLLGSGCLVVDKRPHSIARATCHPSHYWDGRQCRHKGNGHGARKHDYHPGHGKRR